MNKKVGRFGLLVVIVSILSMACFCLPASISDKLFSSQPAENEQLVVEDPSSEMTEAPLAAPESAVEIPQPVSEPQLIRQWAVAAEASSEYGSQKWAAAQAVGEPDVDECGDNGNAWASESADTLEWLLLAYDTPVVPTEIVLYQSYNPSQTVEVFGIDVDGYEYTIWEGEPVWIDHCPDVLTITIDLEEPIVIDQVGVVVDQRGGWGWAEIDAVELVGYTVGSGESVAVVEEPSQDPQPQPQPVDSGSAPANYSGWMAESVYQGYIQVIPGFTRVEALDELIGLTGKKSTDSWKPRDDHADTFIYEMGPEDMKAFIGVTTDGFVYKKSITPNTSPSDFTLDTVTQATYEELDAIYKQDKVIPYAVMADILGSPGFLREQYERQDDGKIVATYTWYHANGDKISGIFYDDMLTGMAGLVFVPKE